MIVRASGKRTLNIPDCDQLSWTTASLTYHVYIELARHLWLTYSGDSHKRPPLRLECTLSVADENNYE